MSDKTKSLKTKKFWVKLIDILVVIAPYIAFIIMILANKVATKTVAILIGTLLVAMFLLIFKKITERQKLPCIGWVVLAGLALALDAVNLKVLIYLIAGSCVLDDLVFTSILNSINANLNRSKQTDDIIDSLKE